MELTSNNSFVSSLALVALSAFGMESLDWEPQMLRDAFQARFYIKKLPQKVFDKLNCGYTLIGTNGYTASIQCFLACNALMNNKNIDADNITYNDMQDIAWGVWEYMNLTGYMKDGAPQQVFDDDIKLYIQKLMPTIGLSKLPKWLAFAQPDDKQLGAINEALADDITAFQLYNQRQQSINNELTAYVAARQAKLKSQLEQLQKQGLIGQKVVKTA